MAAIIGWIKSCVLPSGSYGNAHAKGVKSGNSNTIATAGKIAMSDWAYKYVELFT
jgi:hypothetical protein